jgi:hypothetical protein
LAIFHSHPSLFPSRHFLFSLSLSSSRQQLTLLLPSRQRRELPPFLPPPRLGPAAVGPDRHLGTRSPMCMSSSSRDARPCSHVDLPTSRPQRARRNAAVSRSSDALRCVALARSDYPPSTCAAPSSLFTPVRPRQSLFDSASALFSYE